MPTLSFATLRGLTGPQGSLGVTGGLLVNNDLVINSISSSSVSIGTCSSSSTIACSGNASIGGIVTGPTGSFSALKCSGIANITGVVNGPTALSVSSLACSGQNTLNGTISAPTGSFTSIVCSGTGTFSSLKSTGIVDNGLTVVGNYNANGTYPDSTVASYGMSVAWNQSGTSKEMSLMNNDQNTSSNGGFLFRQRTAASANTTLLNINRSGNVTATTQFITANIGSFTNLYNNSVNVAASDMYRNRITNGDMRIDQRNSGASITNINGTNFPVDRVQLSCNVASKLTAQRSTTAPEGFIYSLCMTSSSAYTCATSDYFTVQLFVEGNHMADLQYGTSNASSATFSFWARSSIAGTFGVRFSNGSFNRYYMATYSIATANTFQFCTINVPGDTTGTWYSDYNAGLYVNFSLGTGSTRTGAVSTVWANGNILQTSACTNLVATSGATLYITGLQFEKGSTNTQFEVRPYDDEFRLCQRHYQVVPAYAPAVSFNGSTAYAIYTLPTPMRTSPTGLYGVGTYTLTTGTTNITTTTAPTTSNVTSTAIQFTLTGLSTSSTAGLGGYLSSFPTIALSTE